MDPVRTCLGCRQRSTTPFLLRVVAQDGVVVPDVSGTLPGRGAWVHPSLDCLDTALTRKAFGRALRRRDVAVDEDMLRSAITTIRTERPALPGDRADHARPPREEQ